MKQSTRTNKTPIKSHDLTSDFSKIRKPNADKWSFLKTKPFKQPSFQERHLS